MKSLTAIAIFLLSAISPSRAWAQAEPAPAGYVPPGHHQAVETSYEMGDRWHLMVFPRLAVSLAEQPNDLGGIGYGGGVSGSYAILPLGPLRLGIGLSFSFDRFSHDQSNSDTVQSLDYAAFAAMLVLDGLVGPKGILRPFIAAGGGFSVAQYQAPGPPRIDEVDVVGLFKAELGLGVRVYQADRVGVELGVHGDIDATFSSFKTGTPLRSAFSPGLAAFSLDLGFRF